MDKEYSMANSELEGKKVKLAKEMEKVDKLEKEFTEAKLEKQKLDQSVILTEERLKRAKKLTSGLAGEYERWKVNIKDLDEKIRRLVGDVFIASACISYYSPFTGVFRQKLVKKWLEKCAELKIPASENFDLSETMGDPV